MQEKAAAKEASEQRRGSQVSPFTLEMSGPFKNKRGPVGGVKGSFFKNVTPPTDFAELLGDFNSALPNGNTSWINNHMGKRQTGTNDSDSRLSPKETTSSDSNPAASRFFTSEETHGAQLLLPSWSCQNPFHSWLSAFTIAVQVNHRSDLFIARPF